MINDADADAAVYIAGGEPIQLLLKLAKHDFEYETFTLEEFGNADSAYHKRKAAGEFGTFAACGGGLPIYKENGKKFLRPTRSFECLARTTPRSTASTPRYFAYTT